MNTNPSWTFAQVNPSTGATVWFNQAVSKDPSWQEKNDAVVEFYRQAYAAGFVGSQDPGAN